MSVHPIIMDLAAWRVKLSELRSDAGRWQAGPVHTRRRPLSKEGVEECRAGPLSAISLRSQVPFMFAVDHQTRINLSGEVNTSSPTRSFPKRPDTCTPEVGDGTQAGTLATTRAATLTTTNNRRTDTLTTAAPTHQARMRQPRTPNVWPRCSIPLEALAGT